MSPTLTERNPSERPVAKRVTCPECNGHGCDENGDQPCPECGGYREISELRAIDCKTTRDWQRWARERREYEDPYGYDRGRF